MTRIPDTMTAISISAPGGPNVLEPVTMAVPQATENEILIKVEAAGVNRPDVLQRLGLYDPPKGAPAGPGLEVSGRIVALGRQASRYTIGDEVCALVAGAGYAEFVTVDERHALPVPQGISTRDAGGLPETYFTVWHNVFERGGLRAGESLLVHGGSSGIGTTAIQLASKMGATVYATAGSDEKCQACVELGATRAINYLKEDYVAALKEETARIGVNVILDMVGGDYIERNYSVASMDGRIVQIAFLNGPQADVNFTKLMIKRLTHTGSTMRPQSKEAKARIAAGLEETAWPLLEAGEIKPVIHATLPLSKAAEAHRMMEESKHIGKILLLPGAD